MKTMLFLALLVVGIQPSFGQTPIRLSFGDGEREFPLTSSPVFDRSGDYLITVLGPKVRGVLVTPETSRAIHLSRIKNCTTSPEGG